MGFGSLLVLRFSLFLSAKRLSFACGLPTTIQQQRRIPSLSAFYTHWQIERKVEKFKFRARLANPASQQPAQHGSLVVGVYIACNSTPIIVSEERGLTLSYWGRSCWVVV